eukprot:TRINITY_DN6276_c0_g2_i2.p1 TRINITY_DN6276_c0_g2~~TRINITY_DN6276_c0_g2_i2.p1  ORF type:complete len:128 (+),score=17.16 TRINITY_DN6276_c0_g2_i2:65-448(+)
MCIRDSINIMMGEAFTQKWQEYRNPQEPENVENKILLQVAELLKINVFTSSPLFQGEVIQLPLESDIFQCKSQGAKHLQIIRSIPFEALLSTLVGMKRSIHVRNNLEVINYDPLTKKEFLDFFKPKD